jgi:hypothetical protein
MNEPNESAPGHEFEPIQRMLIYGSRYLENALASRINEQDMNSNSKANIDEHS